jgi:hypothetical protein
MSATYNWSYRPAVENKYGFTFSGGDGDVSIMHNYIDDNGPGSNICYYVALYGNDLTGNGSRLYPFRTLSSVPPLYNNVVQFVIMGTGVYRESPSNLSYVLIIGDGDVRIDATLSTDSGSVFRSGGINSVYNITFTGAGSVVDGQFHNIYDCRFISCRPTNRNGYISYGNSGPKRCLSISNNPESKNITFQSFGLQNTRLTEYTTYINHNIQVGDSNNDGSNGSSTSINACIFYNCQINYVTSNTTGPIEFCYSLFHNCSFKFGGETQSFTYLSISELANHATSIYGNSNLYFNNCHIGDPLFNNPEIGDYTLSVNSPAKNMSYSGSYIGVHSIASAIKSSPTASYTGFDLDTNINLSVSDDSITLVDTTKNAQIDSIVISNLTQREISGFPSYGFNADRNGQYIDSIEDLGIVVNPSMVLSYPSSYLVQQGAINYNNKTYQPGDRFTTLSGTVSFTSTGGSLVEMAEAPQRHTIMARFGNGDGVPLTSSNSLISQNWYYVSTGQIIYNSVAYSNTQMFKASSQSNFTGTGSVTLSMSNESFQHYESGIRPTTNNVEDLRTGEVLRGNGDPNYIRGKLNVNEFPINAKYIQVRYIIKVNNLKP